MIVGSAGEAGKLTLDLTDTSRVGSQTINADITDLSITTCKASSRAGLTETV